MKSIINRVCENCQHWVSDEAPGSSFVVTERDACGHIVSSEYRDGVARRCSKAGNIDDGAGGYSAIPAAGFSLDYPVCDLWTGPQFGCVHFEVTRETL